MTAMKSTPRTARIALLLALAAPLGVLYAAGSDSAPAPSAENKYIGADKCKSCHGSPDSGDQYSAWKTMDHAKAFEALASEEAKKAGADKGIADPQKADECVRCHVTAFGKPETEIKKGFDRANGVQCESCHGPGEAHLKARFAAAAKGDAPQGYVQIPADEIIAVPKMETCVECHNDQSPTYKEFCFHEFGAKVRHLNPKKPRTAVDIGNCTCPKCANGCPESCKALTQVK
jgi:hypothetical protein